MYIIRVMYVYIIYGQLEIYRIKVIIVKQIVIGLWVVRFE